MWMFLSYVCITVGNVFTGAGTCPCLREYFSLGGCVGLGSYNIFGYCTVYFTLGRCISLAMSNAIGGGVVIPLSLELAQWYCWEGLFRLMAFSMAHQVWQVPSEVLVKNHCLPRLVTTQLFGGPFGRVWSGPPCRYGLDTAHWFSCESGLLLGLDCALKWEQCLCNIRVIGSISNSSDNKLWYIFRKIIHFGRVLLVMVLKGNIWLVIVSIFHFGRVNWSGNHNIFCYFTLGGCCSPESKILWYDWNVMASWLEMWPVPPHWCTLVCQDVVASPSVWCTSYNANLPFILPWKEIGFFTYHQCSLGLCSLGLVMALGVLGLQCN